MKNPPPRWNAKDFIPALNFRESLTIRKFEYPDVSLQILYRAVSDVQHWLQKARRTAAVEVENRRRTGDLRD